MKKKRNRILRKRVMRTASALTMVMAVALAAIPVENLGSVSAEGEATTNITLDYTGDVVNSKDYEYYDSSKYEYGTPNDKDLVTIERIENGVFLEVFKAQKKSTTSASTLSPAIVYQSIATESNINPTLEIKENEYYDYTCFNSEFIQEVTNNLKSAISNTTEKALTAKFSNGTKQTDYASKEVKYAGSDGEVTATLSAINNVYKLSYEVSPTYNTLTLASSVTANDYANGYVNFLAELSSEDVYKDETGKDFYDTRIKEIDSYNTSIDEAYKELSGIYARAISTPSNISADDVSRWNELSASLTSGELHEKYTTLQILSKGLSDFDNGQSLNKLVDYTIRQNCHATNTTDNLKAFELIQTTTLDGHAMYIPKLKSGGMLSSNQYRDEEGYLVTGMVNIVGVRSEAYKGDRAITKLVLPKSVTFIGESAFEGSNLRDVTLSLGACTIIGKRAFAECGRLSNIDFTDSSSNLEIIDKEAFEGTGLTNIEIPNSVTTIGAGAFANSSVLATLSFVQEGDANVVTIDPYAFYDCEALSSVTFPQIGEYKINKAAFAVAPNTGGAMEEFIFPASNKYIDYSNASSTTSGTSTTIDHEYDYILANRTKLLHVTMPGKLMGSIPDNTLFGCTALKDVTFLEDAKLATYTPDELFKSVYEPSFYVIGPKNGSTGEGSTATPRQTTWKAKAGLNNDGSYKLASVPYMFTDSNGTHFEIGVKEKETDENPKYIAQIDQIGDTYEAVLSNYFAYDSSKPSQNLHITIPAKVGDYTVVEIGENCFNDDIKPYVYRLTIQDDSIRKINDNAFSKCENLQLVDIGDSVTYIGSNAFANCTKLENVVFSQTTTDTYSDDDPNWSTLELVENAFNTQSKYLTFHGAINSEYAPFKLAMSADGINMTSSKSQICYKTDAPLNLTVIRDSNGVATLIDYPHYDEIDYLNADLISEIKERYNISDSDDYSMVDKFEVINGIQTDTTLKSKYSQFETMDSDENNVVLQTLNMVLPKGIESIDSKSYFTNTNNSNDFIYFNLSYEDTGTSIKNITINRYLNTKPNAEGIHNVRDLYSTYEGVVSKESDTVAGLFSGFFDETPKNSIKPSSNLVNEEAGIAVLDGDTLVGGNVDSSQSGSNVDSSQSGSNVDSSQSGSNVDQKPDEINDTTKNDKDNNDTNNPATGGTGTVNSGTSSNVSQGSALMGGVYNKHTYTEESSRGYDYLTSINLKTIESLPDYAFDSAENLKKVTISSSLQNVGAQPFRNCINLDTIDTTDSTRYAYDNMIFYENEGDDANPTYEIVECLEARGENELDINDNFGSTNIDSSTDPLLSMVSSIADYAFADIDSIYSVDLSSTSAQTIPVGAFSGCTKLTKVKLPETVNRIDEDAFEDVAVGNRLTVNIPNPNCTIDNNAFDFENTGSINIEGVKYYNEKTQEPSTTYNSYLQLVKLYGDKNIEFDDLGSTYTLTFRDDDLNYIDSIKVKSGESLTTPPTAPLKNGYTFDYWMTAIDSDDPIIGADCYSNVTEDRTILAHYYEDPSSVLSDGQLYELNVENGKAMIVDENKNASIVSTFPTTIYGGTQVTLIANNENDFKVWSIAPNSYTNLIKNPSIYTTSFTMPNANVTVTANDAVTGDGTVGGSNGTDGTNGTNGTNGTGTNGTSGTSTNGTSNKSAGEYTVTVNYGSGSGSYNAGDVVSISAYAPTSSTKVFSKWTSSNSNVGFADSTAATTTFVMPASDVTITANYKTRSDDDDDDDTVSARPGTSTSTTTVSSTPSNSSASSSSTKTTSSTDDNGNKIYITKNGVSNKDVASVQVTGSSDNFVVKISESDEANEMAKQALTNTYGSLDSIQYFPMDISLYDSTGQNKITDTTGLNITVTMPIPDVLIQYGGNARVAATDNGNLQQVTPKFTTIDGIACISFVPPHFSPYVIYVDTSNLTAGLMYDSTPSTGDPIHPKWFAVIGMACVSVLLFVGSDGRRRRRYRTA